MPMNPRLLRPLARFQAPVAFDPTAIAGLAVWLDASDSSTLYDETSGGDLVGVDSGVGRWEDKSGVDWHATQGTANDRPLRRAAAIDGLDALEFDGTSDWLQIAENGIGNTGNLTVFAVVKIASGQSGTRVMFNKGDAASFEGTVWEMDAGGGKWYGYADNNWYTSVANNDFPTGTAFVAGGRTENRVSQLYFDNVAAGPASGASPGVNDIQQFIGICGGGTSGGGPMSCVLGEVLIYDAAIALVDQDAVFAYLASKWGIV